ncbi:uncharacterized protein LOC123263212 [Cotesia glomerata]|uniref:uncharacterized protein LOC123263212 n=1 Tax=Cotesia glomerata TaxID=32391 RepID=UPI001D009963|nr:uncharacterized protein LOC123263212 [Cotesia glomerata]
MSTLYYLLTFFIVSSAIFVEINSYPHKISDAEKLCAKEHNINGTLSEYIYNGTKDIKIKIGKDKLHCAMGCFLKGFGMITKESIFDASRFLNLLPHLTGDLKLDDKAKKIVKACDKIKSECPCHTTILVANCWPRALREYFQKEQWLPY